MSDDIQYGIRLTGDASGVKAAFVEGGQAAKKFSEDVVATGSAAQSLIDKYDPLGARLRSLKQDFQALSEAARTGQIAQGDDARVDATYQRIRKQIKDTEEAINSFGAAGQKGFKAAADAADKSAFATAGARRELIVLAHEAVGGNFSRMPGSFMVLAERVSAGGEALLAFGAAAAVVAGATYLVTKGLSDAAQETRGFNNAIAATGGFSGKTRDDLVSLSRGVADSAGIAVSQAKQLVLEMDRSGRIGAQAFDSIALSVAKFATATGTSVESATKTLIRAFEDPAKGAEQLNAQLHFLSNAELDRIKSAQDSNRLGEAQADLAGRLIEKLKDQETHVSLLTRAWKGLSDTWNGLFEDKTISDKIAEAQKKADLYGNYHDSYSRQESQRWLDEVARLRAQQQAKQQAAAAQEADAEQNQKNSYARSLIGRYSRNYRVKELDDQEQAIRALKPSSDDEAEYQRTALEEIERRKKLEQTSREDRAAANKAAEEQYRAAIAVQEGLQKRESDALKAHLADLASQRKRGLISAQEETQQSYASQRASIDKEIASLKIEKEAAKGPGKIGDAARYDQQIQALQQKRIELIQQEANALAELSAARQKATAALTQSFSADTRSVLEQESLIGLDQRAAQKENYSRSVAERLRKATTDDSGKVRDNVDVAGMTDAAHQAVANYSQALDDLKAKQDAYNADWKNGAAEALRDYTEHAKNTAALTREAMTSAMNATSDAIVRFATTGKVSFSDFTRSILGDLAKIAAEKATAGIFGSLFGSIAGATAAANGAVFGGLRPMATGGVLDRPTTFSANGNTRVLAGEAGDEGVLPLKRTRDGKLGVIAQGGGGGSQITQNFYVTVSGGDNPEDTGNRIADQLGRQMKAIALATIVEQKRVGGVLQGVPS